MRSKRPNAGCEPLQPARRSRPASSRAHARPPPPRARCRRCRGPGARSSHAPRPSGVTRSKATLSSPVAARSRARRRRAAGARWPHAGQRYSPRWPTYAAAYAYGRPAAQAVLRVGGVLERRARLRGIVDAERRRCARARRPRSPTSGSSALTTSVASSGELANHRPPPLGDDLELAVAVELVAEQVPERDARGRTRRADLRERRLVDLEQPELGARARPRARRRRRRSGSRPAALCASRTRGRQDRGGHRARVVVFPFVADTSARAVSEAAPRARRPRPDRPPRAASPARSCRRRAPRQPREPRRRRGQAPTSSARRIGASLVDAARAQRTPCLSCTLRIFQNALF